MKPSLVPYLVSTALIVVGLCTYKGKSVKGILGTILHNITYDLDITGMVRIRDFMCKTTNTANSDPNPSLQIFSSVMDPLTFPHRAVGLA